MNPLTKVSQLMATELITIPEYATLGVARHLLSKHGIHHLPVVSEDGRLLGVFGSSDLLKELGNYNAERPVKEVMTTGLAKLESDDTIRTAASVFRMNAFHSLPVVEGSKLIGILTTHDLIKFIDDEKVELKDYKK